MDVLPKKLRDLIKSKGLSPLASSYAEKYLFRPILIIKENKSTDSGKEYLRGVCLDVNDLHLFIDDIFSGPIPVLFKDMKEVFIQDDSKIVKFPEAMQQKIKKLNEEWFR